VAGTRVCVFDDGIGRKAGTGLQVVATSVIRADGEEQGVGAWRRTGRDLGAWRLELDDAGEVGGWTRRCRAKKTEVY
jgi:hypothetical protein